MVNMFMSRTFLAQFGLVRSKKIPGGGGWRFARLFLSCLFLCSFLPRLQDFEMRRTLARCNSSATVEKMRSTIPSIALCKLESCSALCPAQDCTVVKLPALRAQCPAEQSIARMNMAPPLLLGGCWGGARQACHREQWSSERKNNLLQGCKDPTQEKNEARNWKGDDLGKAAWSLVQIAKQYLESNA